MKVPIWKAEVCIVTGSSLSGTQNLNDSKNGLQHLSVFKSSKNLNFKTCII